jgi:hypothetical protein
MSVGEVGFTSPYALVASHGHLCMTGVAKAPSDPILAPLGFAS